MMEAVPHIANVAKNAVAFGKTVSSHLVGFFRNVFSDSSIIIAGAERSTEIGYMAELILEFIAYSPSRPKMTASLAIVLLQQ
jgi:hypothetical protein